MIKKLETKINFFTVNFFSFILQNYPTFHSELRLVHLARGREYFVGLSKLLAHASPPSEVSGRTSRQTLPWPRPALAWLSGS